MHLSCHKNGISGSLTFHESKLHVINHNLLPDSVLKNPFYHFHSMFQQFDPSVRSTLHRVAFAFCRLAVPHLISNLQGCFLLSQYHYINLISTGYQSPLWLVSFSQTIININGDSVGDTTTKRFCISPNPNVLVAVSNGMQTVELRSEKNPPVLNCK